MRDGICLKCGSEEVYLDDGFKHGIVIPVNTFTTPPTILYICADCGYLEFYAQSGSGLEKVREQFQKVKR